MNKKWVIGLIAAAVVAGTVSVVSANVPDLSKGSAKIPIKEPKVSVIDKSSLSWNPYTGEFYDPKDFQWDPDKQQYVPAQKKTAKDTAPVMNTGDIV